MGKPRSGRGFERSVSHAQARRAGGDGIGGPHSLAIARPPQSCLKIVHRFWRSHLMPKSARAAESTAAGHEEGAQRTSIRSRSSNGGRFSNFIRNIVIIDFFFIIIFRVPKGCHARPRER